LTLDRQQWRRLAASPERELVEVEEHSKGNDWEGKELEDQGKDLETEKEDLEESTGGKGEDRRSKDLEDNKSEDLQLSKAA